MNLKVINNIAIFLFVTGYAVSYSYGLGHSLGFYNLYVVKIITTVFLVLVAIISNNHKITKPIFLFLLFVLSYTIISPISNILYALQLWCFLVIINSELFKDYYLTIWVKCIFLSILLILLCDILLVNGNTIYTSINGRPKLQLGWSHPKPLAHLILAIIVIYISKFKNRSDRKIIIIFSLFLLLYYIDSRTTLLSAVLYMVSIYSKRLSIGVMLILVTVFIFLVAEFWTELDYLMSGRLSIWKMAVTGESVYMANTYLSSNRSMVDNFWIGQFIDVGLLFTLPCIIFILMFLNSTNNKYQYSGILALAILSFFDSGLFSITSVVGLVVFGSVWRRQSFAS